MEEDSNEESYDPNDPVWKYCKIVYPSDINDPDSESPRETTPKVGTCPTKYHHLGANKNVKYDLEPSKKRPRLAGLTDNFSTLGNDKQAAIEEARKELWEKACTSFSQWFFEAGIPFSAIYSPSFQKMVDAIGKFGPGAKGPSYEELAGPLLDKAVEDVKTKYVNPCKEEWAIHGCTLMVDSWTGEDDSGECERTFINFLVNSPIGSVYMESVDASDYGDDGHKLFEVIDRIVELVGESKVVQVITGNSRAMVLAGTFLETKRPNLYWTPCVSRCVNSILEDISKIPSFKASLKRVENVISYIYIRPRVVNMLRQFTGQEDLVRPGITTLATAFLTLERVLSLRRKLCYMVISQEWEGSKWFKEARGEMITKTILSTLFWDNVEKMLKIYRPLIRVWRLVDGEKRPSMGYIYDAMSKAKEAIRDGFDGKENKYYKEAWEIIDKRWDCLRPLHRAGHYLNPVFFNSYKNGMIVPEEVADGFISSVERLVLDHDEQEKITTQVCIYRRAEGLFGKNIAIRQRSTLSPVEWWQIFGAKTPELQKFAIKVLSLTCSAVGSERNWSIFKHIHKRRNRLAQMCWKKRLYVKYNQALKLRYKGRDRLFAMKDIDDHDNEWLVGNMHELSDLEESVFEGGELTWATVATAIGAADELALKIAKSKEVEEGRENEHVKVKENASPSFRSSFLRLKGVQEEDEEKVNEKYECMIDEEDENEYEEENEDVDENENEDEDDENEDDDE